MKKSQRKKQFAEMTIMEKEAEIHKLEKTLRRKKIMYKISIPLTVISMISTVLFIVMLCMGKERIYSISPLLCDWLLVFLFTAFISMVLCVHVFAPVYWVKSVLYLKDVLEENLSGDLFVDFIVTAIFIAIPVTIEFTATFFAPGFYCIKRTVDLKDSIKGLTDRIESYKSVIYPYDGDFEVISAYKM